MSGATSVAGMAGMAGMATTGRADAVDGVVKTTVEGLGYELVAIEHAPRGLLRVYIDRVPGQDYVTGPGESVTVDDCGRVTRQLQFALEVENADYARLEVSSPGLDRPLRKEADFRRFAGQAVEVLLRQPFKGRKTWRGVLAAADEGWSLQVDDGKDGQLFGFKLEEVRDARLVPVVDFRGRRPQGANAVPDGQTAPGVDEGQDR